MSRAAHLEEAAEHARKGRWSKAIDGYRLVLAEEPDNAELRVLLADAYKRVKNDERAFHHFHRSGVLFLGKGDPARAAGALIEANALTPNVPDVLWRLCEALKLLGRGDDLVPYLVALIRAAPAPGDRRRLWALEELFALHPDDLSVAQQRAEALAEADRIDDAVLAYKKLAARLGQREAELVQVLFRAAKIATGRSDLGADIAGVLLAHGRAKDALAVIVGFYEKTPDDLAVLETLLRCLEALGATEKAVAARIELVKARAAAGSRSQVLVEVDALLLAAPEDPVALEVSAHALALVREPSRAQDAWRRLLKVAERRGLRAERDRAIAAVLKFNPDDEDALELAIQMHAAAARFQESDALRQRLLAVRALKKRSLMPAPAKLEAKLENKRLSVPAPSASSPLGQAGLPDDPSRTGTMVLSDEDVLDVRGSERSQDREHDPVPERSDATPVPTLDGVQARERADTLRPTPTPTPVLTPALPVHGDAMRSTPPPKAKTPVPPASTFEIPLPSNPWFEGRERRKASATQLGGRREATPDPRPPEPRRDTQPPKLHRPDAAQARRPRTDELPGGMRERRSPVADPASYPVRGQSGEDTGEELLTRTGEMSWPGAPGSDPAMRAALAMRALPPSVETAPLPSADGVDEMTWEADEPTTMDTRAVKHLRSLTENVAVHDLGPATLPGELTHPGFATLPAVLPDIVDDLDLDSEES